jgi:hypothetical protein
VAPIADPETLQLLAQFSTSMNTAAEVLLQIRERKLLPIAHRRLKTEADMVLELRGQVLYSLLDQQSHIEEETQNELWQKTKGSRR